MHDVNQMKCGNMQITFELKIGFEVKTLKLNVLKSICISMYNKTKC